MWRRAIPLGILVCIGTAVHAYFYAQGFLTFNYDETWTLLAAKRYFDTFLSAYPPGQQYYSSIDSLYLSFMQHFIEPQQLFLARMPRLLFVSLLYGLFAYIVDREWGRGPALLATALFILPTVDTYRRWMDYTVILQVALAVIAVFWSILRCQDASSWRYAALGVLVGIGLWASQDFRLYIVLLPFLFLLSSQAWKNVCAYFSKRNVLELYIFSLYALLFLITILTQFRSLRREADWGYGILVVLLMAILLPLFLFTTNRWKLCLQQLSFVSGFLIGLSPVIVSYFQSVNPQGRLWFRYDHLQDRFMDIFYITIPDVLGGFTVGERVWVTVLFVLPVLLLSLLFFWRRRGAIVKALQWQPLTRDDVITVCVAALLVLPLFANALYSGQFYAGYIQIVRVILLMTASVTVFEAFKGRWLKLLVVWLLCAGLFLSGLNLLELTNRWARGDTWLAVEKLSEVESFFHEHGVLGGYAPHEVAYGLSYLFEDRIIFVPHRGRKRFPDDRDFVNGLDQFGLIIRRREVDKDDPLPSSVEHILSFAHERFSPEHRAHLSQSQMTESKAIDRWMLFVLTRRDSFVGQ